MQDHIESRAHRWRENSRHQRNLQQVYNQGHDHPNVPGDFLNDVDDVATTIYEGDYFTLCEVSNTHVRRFGIRGRRFDLHFKGFERVTNIEQKLEQIFDQVIDLAFSRTRYANSLIGMEFDFVGLPGNSILVKFQPRRFIRGWKVLRTLQRVLVSYVEISVHNPCHVNLILIENPTGGGTKFLYDHARHVNYYSRGHGRLIKTCIGDNYCLGVAVILGWYYYTNKTRYKQLCRNRKRLDRLGALVLERAGIEPPCGIDDVKRLQAIINAQLIVFDKQKLSAVVHCGDAHKVTIALCLYDNHYTLIRSIPRYLNKTFYCLPCRRAFSVIGTHICSQICKRCLSKTPCVGDKFIICARCKRGFVSTDCLRRHKQQRMNRNGQLSKSTCDRLQMCTKCNRASLVDSHKCGVWFCSTCRVDVPSGEAHVCYVQPLTIDDDDSFTKYIFYDFETRGPVHEVCYAIALVVCDYCFPTWAPNSICKHCQESPRVRFRSIEPFVTWLFQSIHVDAQCFAHNARYYYNCIIFS